MTSVMGSNMIYSTVSSLVGSKVAVGAVWVALMGLCERRMTEHDQMRVGQSRPTEEEHHSQYITGPDRGRDEDNMSTRSRFASGNGRETGSSRTDSGFALLSGCARDCACVYGSCYSVSLVAGCAATGAPQRGIYLCTCLHRYPCVRSCVLGFGSLPMLINIVLSGGNFGTTSGGHGWLQKIYLGIFERTSDKRH